MIVAVRAETIARVETGHTPYGPAPADPNELRRIVAALVADERRVPITASRPPTVTALDGAGLPYVKEEEATRIGHTLSGRFLRLIGHPDAMGSAYPFTRAILGELPVWCRKQHRIVGYHDGGSRTICATIARRTIVWRASLETVAETEGVPLVRAEALLDRALREAWIVATDFAMRSEKQ